MITSFGVQPQPPNPKEFLRKGTRKCRDGARIPSVEHHNRKNEARRPNVPLRDDRPVQGLQTSKKYLNCNAIEVINRAPRKRKDTEVPYNAREDYGKVPAYLETVKAEIKREKDLVDTFVEEQYGPVNGSHQDNEVMDEQERRELINKLKQRWGDVNAEYQKYCHKVNFDTPGERKRKASQEAELKQLEGFIEKLSCPGSLVVKS